MFTYLVNNSLLQKVEKFFFFPQVCSHKECLELSFINIFHSCLLQTSEKPNSQNCRKVWVGGDLLGHLIPTSLPWVGTLSSRSDCSKTHPTWTLPGTGYPQLLWATCFCASPASRKECLCFIKPKPTVFLFEVLPPPSCQLHHTA